MAKTPPGPQHAVPPRFEFLRTLIETEEDEDFLEALRDQPSRVQDAFDLLVAAKILLLTQGVTKGFSNAELTRLIRLLGNQFEQENQSAITSEKRRLPQSPSLKLPKSPPEVWAERDLNLKETAPDFVRRVYKNWLGKGLERRHIASLDAGLYKALSVWLTRNPGDPIVDLLPPNSRTTKALIDRLSQDYSLQDLRKLGYAAEARLRRIDPK